MLVKVKIPYSKLDKDHVFSDIVKMLSDYPRQIDEELIPSSDFIFGLLMSNEDFLILKLKYPEYKYEAEI